MGKFVNDVKEFFKFCDENEVEFVDFRFTDLKGTWHHVSYNYKRLPKDFADGIPFDASSVEAWQPIDKSDMIHSPRTLRSSSSATFMISIKTSLTKNARARSLKKPSSFCKPRALEIPATSGRRMSFSFSMT